MMTMNQPAWAHIRLCTKSPESGFTLAEFLIAACVFLAVSAAAFGMLTEIQRIIGYESEVGTVLDNTRIGMQLVKEYIQQAGNDPFDSGLTAITILGPKTVQIRSDLTGSDGTANGSKGDPDGDTNDSGEDVIIRFNDQVRRLEVVPFGGSAQIIANHISDFSIQYFDAAGNPVATGAQVRKIRVTISGTSMLPDPQTRRAFGIELTSDIRILT